MVCSPRPEIEAAVQASFARWTSDLAPGTDFEAVYVGYTEQTAEFDFRRPEDQQNVVLSASGAEARAIFGGDANFLALTLTSFSVETGEIFDADIVFNTEANTFVPVDGTCDPRSGINGADDDGDGDVDEADEAAPYDLENTLVHEIGHFFGFDHVIDREATMFRERGAL